ncbi:DUF1127 domain-containing protein [Billgrantia antri]|uniref:DUF1127 domain-containing protein n=1 Tax=Halomonas sulfidivorans TaxID=2733488 RepID=A0ABX7WMW6_9GAMM|nr:DUF1127 domain-containing protein [Halomonas sulfidivorans]QTP60029.1 DUF1127 domain-containing protein [Halomonas sulfidivorans]
MRAPDTCYDASSCTAPGRVESAQRFFSSPWQWLRRLSYLMQLRRERNQLLELSDHQLRDIGLTRRDVAREARRHLWDVSGWRR